MSNLLVQAKEKADQDGNVIKITPESAGWDYVGFEVYKLTAGQSFEKSTHDKEMAVVILSGIANVTTKNNVWKEIGKRMSVFEKTPAFTIYVSVNDKVELESLSNLEFAVCTSPGKGAYKSRLIQPEDVNIVVRGSGNMQRKIHNIIAEDQPSEGLFVIEVFTPQGNWSSYPPHKHDKDNMPFETYLEETYYHKINPANNGFAVQRVYNDDHSLDETIVVKDGQAVLVPEGYHPVSAPPGYDLYYLNVMAGPIKKWRFTNDKDHEWLLK